MRRGEEKGGRGKAGQGRGKETPGRGTARKSSPATTRSNQFTEGGREQGASWEHAETERRMQAEWLTRQMENKLREAERVANAMQGSSLEQRDKAFWMVERGEIQLTQQVLGRGAGQR